MKAKIFYSELEKKIRFNTLLLIDKSKSVDFLELSENERIKLCQNYINKALDEVLENLKNGRQNKDKFSIWIKYEGLIQYAFIYQHIHENLTKNSATTPKYQIDISKLEQIMQLFPSHMLDNIVREWFVFINVLCTSFLEID